MTYYISKFIKSHINFNNTSYITKHKPKNIIKTTKYKSHSRVSSKCGKRICNHFWEEEKLFSIHGRPTLHYIHE